VSVDGEPGSSLAGLPRDLVDRLRRERDCNVVSAAEIPAGQNNRLLRLETDGGPLLAKLYVQDDRDRVGREFGLLAFLGERGYPWTPRAVLRDTGRSWAVYSFEAGRTRRAEDWTVEDSLALGRAGAALHELAPLDCPVDFPLAITPMISLALGVERIGTRLRDFLDDAAAREPERVRELMARVDLVATVEDLTARAAAGLDAATLAQSLPRERRRLTSCDVGPHNVMWRPDGDPCIVDWEYGGWDDPVALLTCFGGHVTTVGIRPDVLATFDRTYVELAGLDEDDLARMRRIRLLFEVEWLTIHLTGMTTVKVAARRFASADFDLDSYLAQNVAAFDRRLERVRAMLG
jgi:hypothetical protein